MRRGIVGFILQHSIEIMFTNLFVYKLRKTIQYLGFLSGDKLTNIRYPRFLFRSVRIQHRVSLISNSKEEGENSKKDINDV